MCMQKELLCASCGTTTSVWRITGRNHKIGHLKVIWCPTCEAERNFIELPEYVDVESVVDYIHSEGINPSETFPEDSTYKEAVECALKAIKYGQKQFTYSFGG